MEGISEYLRLRTATAVVALLAAAAVLMAVSGSADAFTKKIQAGIVNNSQTPITVQFCNAPDVSAAYYSHRAGAVNPCEAITETHVIGANGHRRSFSNTSFAGMVVTAKGKSLYFFADNPTVGKPFFRYGYNRVIGLGEPEEVFRTVDGVDVGFRRYEDDVREGEIVKVMRIEIRSWP